ncbi:hypothetical protein BDR06DRAFT_1015608 [Suillus hirtellus]|nr:hypothetical protein BDR06DRAFT_1015608 [Suillus hirtellus]
MSRPGGRLSSASNLTYAIVSGFSVAKEGRRKRRTNIERLSQGLGRDKDKSVNKKIDLWLTMDEERGTPPKREKAEPRGEMFSIYRGGQKRALTTPGETSDRSIRQVVPPYASRLESSESSPWHVPWSQVNPSVDGFDRVRCCRLCTVLEGLADEEFLLVSHNQFHDTQAVSADEQKALSIENGRF